jgi:hypothetical protein
VLGLFCVSRDKLGHPSPSSGRVAGRQAGRVGFFMANEIARKLRKAMTLQDPHPVAFGDHPPPSGGRLSGT